MAARKPPLLPYPIQGWFTGSFRQAAVEQGRADLISLWAGQAAPLLRHRKADALVAELVRDTTALFERRGGPRSS